MKYLTVCFLIIICLGCKREIPNQAPVAKFSVEPAFGDTETQFLFDAGLSSDVDQEDSLLWVHWDWEADGYFDGFYLQTKKQLHQFKQAGNYTIRLEVRDKEGLASSAEQSIEVFRGSAAPLEPFAPNPPDSANNIFFNSRLSWVAVDPDDDPMVYDVYLGKDENPPLVASELRYDEFYPEGIEPGEKYYWRVVIRDELMIETTGPVWQFSTHSGEYLRDSVVDSRDGQVYQTLFINKRWWMTENLRFDYPNESYCVDDDNENCEEYGKYYNIWLTDTLVCPKGWTYPTEGDWQNLESHLGMTNDEIRRYGVWRGSDQANQVLVGGTSGLDFKLSGFRDWDGNWHYVGERLYFGNSMNYRRATRMAIEGYGGILRSGFVDAQYTPVRCIK